MDLDPRLRPGGDGGELGSSTATRVVSNASSAVDQQLQAAAHRGSGRDNADTPSTVGSTPGQHHQFDYADAGAGGGGGGGSVAAGSSIGGDADPNGDSKKSRACEACRGLKVKCEPDPVEGEPCKRCRKAGRSCVVTAPTRKRQKKTDSRVSELEKKIDALTASLHARAGAPSVPAAGQHQHQHQQHQHQHQHQHQAEPVGGGYPSSWSSAGTAGTATAGLGGGAGVARAWGGMAAGMAASPMMQTASTPPTRTPQDESSAFQPPIVMAGQKRKATDRDSVSEDPKAMTPSVSWSGFSRPTEGDIVDRGIITMEQAAGLFNKYKEHMVRHLPAVVFPHSATVLELRKTKPTLFLAIMAAATGENHSIQRVLQKELMQLFAEKVIVTGEKNLELVQAIHVAVIWYWPPEHFEELKFYQLVHMAAVMAIDIGLGRKNTSKRGPPPFRRNPPPDPSSIECRRTWLTCFFLALNTSMSLHRPNLIRWTPFMTESLEILESSPDAAPTDKYFSHLVWTHRLAEEVGEQFSLDDPSSLVNITDARTQYALRALERDLDKYIASVAKNMMQQCSFMLTVGMFVPSATLRLNFNVVNLYMHEMALHSETLSDQWRPPFNTEALKDGIVNSEPLSAAHINALSACLTAIDGILNTFLSMDVLSIRCLPVFNFMRVAYAVVILIKMYFSASSPGSEMGRVIHKDNMRVEYYLETLLDKFRATAADNKYLESAMAPAFPPWMSVTQPMVPNELDMGSMPANFDIEGLNLAAADLQDVYESGAKIVMNEPWFMDAFQGLPDPNLFPF
ncbi:hypothetical protein TGAM01_v210357 [Trichoderma gamsii]|uniref:Zn(2)-C6 fungal-type domain-containing protein n=1 Tax=Trichoderma gamsii TaxID=398673 RepID=A0A2P4Z900_9HYPO|nr:hypothetical protein TGAM01_v210357 [Trichoderma gamsii]PON20756.1 hypothetical protein TGAM01_v210357 [Trichoderma gamsii]